MRVLYAKCAGRKQHTNVHTPTKRRVTNMAVPLWPTIHQYHLLCVYRYWALVLFSGSRPNERANAATRDVLSLADHQTRSTTTPHPARVFSHTRFIKPVCFLHRLYYTSTPDYFPVFSRRNRILKKKHNSHMRTCSPLGR